MDIELLVEIPDKDLEEIKKWFEEDNDIGRLLREPEDKNLKFNWDQIDLNHPILQRVSNKKDKKPDVLEEVIEDIDENLTIFEKEV